MKLGKRNGRRRLIPIIEAGQKVPLSALKGVRERRERGKDPPL